MLTVEDGSGLASADSYASLADANAYFTSHPNTLWAGNDAMKEQALRLATQYLDANYGERWRGCRYLSTQRLDWPRDGVEVDGVCIPRATLPPNLVEACFEAAVRYLAFGALAPDVTEGAVLSQSVSVGSISKSTTYAQTGKPPVVKLRVIDLLLQRLLTGRQLERA